MDKKTIFKEIIADFIERPLEGVVPRDMGIPTDIPKIISLLGPRRSGKTHILFDLISRLRKEVPSHRMVYLNFEDDRLFPLQLEDLDLLLRAYYELYPTTKDEMVWFFFDEVQEAPHWEKFVRRMTDTENCRIFLTGSSSRLLSRELATTLRGRTLPFEVFPLSFREFLRFNQVEANPATSKGQALWLHWFDRYLRQGGFPELVSLPPHLHRRTIDEYLDLMLYRDLAERFSIKNTTLLKYLLKQMLGNLAKSVSVTKIYNDLRSQGYSVGKNTLFDYLSYLEEAFVLFRVQIWSRSVRAQAVNPNKVYAIDPAYKYAMSMGEDTGRVFENAVFLQLRRQGIQPSYYLNGNEVDFYWENGRLLQVCYSFSDPATRSREVESLFSAMEALGLSEGYLITRDQREELRRGDKTVWIQAAWEFF